MRLGAALVILSSVTTAMADPAGDLKTEGETLAKAGRFSDAIEKFKAADRIAPKASHACLIALAYTRRELWSQASIFLELCHQRASATDPLPDWVPVAESQLAERIAAANVAPVEIVVTPANTPVKIAVSNFLPDEQFGPRTIHLAPGHHVFVATPGPNTGFVKTELAIDISDKTPKRVEIVLKTPATDVVKPPPIEKPIEPAMAAPQRSRVPLYVMAAGGAMLVGAGAVHLFWFKPARDHLVEAGNPEMPNPVLYDEWSRKFDGRRGVTIGLYAAAGLVVVTGIALNFTVYRSAPVRVGAVPTQRGGLVTFEWSR